MVDELEPQLIRKSEPVEHLSGGHFWFLIILTLILLAVAVSVFGNQADPSTDPIVNASQTPEPTESRQPRIYTISYRSGVFSPTNLRIHAGDTVRFKNEGIFPIRVVSDPHPAHNQVAGFDSVGDIPQGSYFAFTFSAKGIFGYHNERDVAETGTIIVR